MPTEKAIQLAAKAWSQPETEKLTMDTKLVNAFANILDKVEAANTPAHNIIHDIGDRVYIDELKTDGTVVSIWITNTAIQYEVRYFNNGKAECVHMFEWEISTINK